MRWKPIKLRPESDRDAGRRTKLCGLLDAGSDAGLGLGGGNLNHAFLPCHVSAAIPDRLWIEMESSWSWLQSDFLPSKTIFAFADHDHSLRQRDDLLGGRRDHEHGRSRTGEVKDDIVNLLDRTDIHDERIQGGEPTIPLGRRF